MSKNDCQGIVHAFARCGLGLTEPVQAGTVCACGQTVWSGDLQGPITRREQWTLDGVRQRITGMIVAGNYGWALLALLDELDAQHARQTHELLTVLNEILEAGGYTISHTPKGGRE
jgi:hypothetical protein